MKAVLALLCLMTISSTAFAEVSGKLLSCESKNLSFEVVAEDGHLYIDLEENVSGPAYFAKDGSVLIRAHDGNSHRLLLAESTATIEKNRTISVSINDGKASVLTIKLSSPKQLPEVSEVIISSSNKDLQEAIKGSLEITDSSELAFDTTNCVMAK